jgi:hypothetical protein
LLDISGVGCSGTINLSAALPTTPTVEGATEKPSVVSITALSPCIEDKVGRSLYALFALPDGGPYTVSLSSVPLGRSLFAPRARLLDAQGGVLHELPASSFLFRGTNLTALYRSHPDERYLVVTSDPSSVGKPLQRLHEAVQSTYVSTGYVSAVIYTGSDIATNTTWAHNGEVVVGLVSDSPKPKHE